MPTRETVKALITLVEQGQYVAALETFYAEDATMQENLDPVRRGLTSLVAGERHVMATFRSIRTRPVEIFLVDGDIAVINWVFDFETPDGRIFSQDEIAVQHWCDGKIVRERFYYDPAQRTRPAPVACGHLGSPD